MLDATIEVSARISSFSARCLLAALGRSVCDIPDMGLLKRSRLSFLLNFAIKPCRAPLVFEDSWGPLEYWSS